MMKTTLDICINENTNLYSKRKGQQTDLITGKPKGNLVHKEKSNKMQQCTKILLFHIYMKLSMFRATHRPPSGA
jgi:hypothetical protein